MTLQPISATVTRHLHTPGWSVQLPVLRPPVIESWMDDSELLDAVRHQLRAMKRRALDYAEKQSWNPFRWFEPRKSDALAIYLLARSGDLAVRVVHDEPRYRITPQGRKTLNAFRFTRA